MRKVIALVLIMAGCKKDITATYHEAGYGGEGATDGKKMVQGCVWYYAASGGECSTKNILAFCDDGRVCVSDERNPSQNDWKCVQFRP